MTDNNCPKCGESRYWNPVEGVCLGCKNGSMTVDNDMPETMMFRRNSDGEIGRVFDPRVPYATTYRKDTLPNDDVNPLGEGELAEAVQIVSETAATTVAYFTAVNVLLEHARTPANQVDEVRELVESYDKYFSHISKAWDFSDDNDDYEMKRVTLLGEMFHIIRKLKRPSKLGEVG